MAGVSASLELTADEAFREIDRLEQRLARVAGQFGVDLAESLVAISGTEVKVSASVETITESIDSAVDAADPTVSVEADADSITDSIDSAVDAVDATVIVEADTSEAEGSIEDLSGQEVTVSVSADTAEAQDSLDGLGGAAGGATEGLGGLGAAMQGVNQKALAATGGVAGLALGTKKAFTSAVESTGSLEAFNRALGQSADVVRTVNVGSFSADLNELAISLGSSDEGLQDAAVRLFVFGEASGAARPKVEQTTETIIALAANAVALRPSLGDVGTAAEGLGTALARGGRPLQQYGISLSSAEIQARAMQDRLPGVTGELSLFEKSAAGSALAAEQLGDSLAKNIAAGTQNPILRLRAVTERVGELFETIGEPLVSPGLDALESGLKALEPLAEATATALKAYAQAQKIVVDGAGELASKFASIVGPLTGVKNLIPDIGFDKATVDLEAFSEGNPELAARLGLVADGADGASVALEAVSKNQVAAAESAGLYSQAQIVAAIDTATAAGEANVYTAALAALETEQSATAGSAQAQADALADLATKMLAGTVTTEDFATTAAVLGVAVEDITGLMPTLSASVDAFVNNAVAKFPTASDALKDLNDDSKVSAAEFIANLEGQAQSIDKFATVIALATEQGFGNLVDFLTNEGPAVLGPEGPFAAALAEGNVAELALLDQKIGNLETHAVAAGDVLRAAAGPLGVSATALADQISQEYGVALDLTLPIDEQTPEAQAALIKAGVVLGPDAEGAGKAVAGKFEAGADLEASVRRNVALGRIELQATGGILSFYAFQAGREVGASFDAGIALGIIANSGQVRDAARFAVASAEAAARAAARASSPSKLFAELGEDIADGIAVGMGIGTEGVVAEAERIVDAAARATAATEAVAVPAAVAAGAGVSVGGSGTGISIGSVSVDVNVTGALSDDDARRAGAAIAVGFEGELARRQISVDSRIS